MSLAISTLMFNYAAQYITMHFTANVFLDTTGDAKMTQTLMLGENMRLPRLIEGYNLHWGFISGHRTGGSHLVFDESHHVRV